MKLKEIIVVEGKHDSNTLKRFFDCDTIETGGSSINKETMELIKMAQHSRGVIIFTDPDFPGEKIRTTINQAVPNCKNAFIRKDKAKTKHKVGIEHAQKKDLEEALSHLMTYTDLPQTLSYEEYLTLGFSGKENSSRLREEIGKKLFLGKPNAKTLFQRLNMLQMNKAQIEAMVNEIEEKQLP